MKKISYVTLAVILVFLVSISTRAAMMDLSVNGAITDDHTAREEQEGKALWQQIRIKENPCLDLTDENFAVLGEYFMGQMAGASHAAMNAMMTRMMGEDGEEQMHVVMGKRFSGCDTATAYPSNALGFMPMMAGMMGWQTLGKGGDSNMMGNFGAYGYGSSFFGFFGMLIMIIFWVLVIVAIVALIRWLIVQSQGSGRSNHAFDILKERYAKGEINKEEFEAKKQDLS
ncbi:MAG: hypothetical protein UX68_C0011G0017 [Parcubacteria group bacterium GW2011_GWA2_46_9]|nr:MAG: hypothetical protein UX68_C0011G0017 [Parcubacteria group bacterium GW2011_GWA2_46_9]